MEIVQFGARECALPVARITLMSFRYAFEYETQNKLKV